MADKDNVLDSDQVEVAVVPFPVEPNPAGINDTQNSGSTKSEAVSAPFRKSLNMSRSSLQNQRISMDKAPPVRRSTDVPSKVHIPAIGRPSMSMRPAGYSAGAGAVVSGRASQEAYRASLERTAAYHTIRQSLQLKRDSVEATRPPPSPVTPTRKAKKSTQKVAERKSEYEVTEHAMPLQELAVHLSTSLDPVEPGKSMGISSAEADSRLLKYGKNKLTPPPGIPEWVKYLKQYINPFMVLLEVAGILCFIAYGLLPAQTVNLVLACVLFGIVIITCTINYYQERKSGKVMESFKNMLPSFCRAIRDGAETKIKVEDLVPGDVVIITAGDKVPADLRILSSNDIKVDNSSLTGESEPQSRKPECTDDNAMETANLAFYSTLVLNGEGRGVVIRTGDETLIGKIASLAGSTSNVKTTLQVEIEHFVRFIAILAMSMGGIYFGVAVGLAFKNQKPDQTTTEVVINALINTIGIIVANVPEGLPATVVLCLTITCRRMAERNVFVKKLEAVETLGSTTVIASDKTGTLTQNRMTAAHIMCDHVIYSAVEGANDIFDRTSPTCARLLDIAANCNRSDYDRVLEGNMEKAISDRATLGDASESALLRLTDALEDIQQQRSRAPKVFEIPFNSTNKWQLSVHAVKNLPHKLLMMKGAPEIVFNRCSNIMIQGKVVPITEVEKATFESSYETLGSMGERVLGFAMIELPADEFPEDYPYDPEKLNFPVTCLTFVGLISLIDPPRPSVPGAIEKCKRAGIRVIMVTGDHPITAKAIAKQIGIIWDPVAEDVAKENGQKLWDVLPRDDVQAVVVKGADIPALTEEQWGQILSKQQIVFARTSPQQKLLIVEHLQARKEIVAVTGDGVNDSPALRKADVGIAMGIVGSDVSKEAADIILMDDSFASIVTGIEQGRVIFDNLKKSIAYTLTHLAPEIMPFLVSINGNVPTLLSSLLILFIDLGTEMVPAVSLAYEEQESDIMSRPPRDASTDRMVSGPVLLYSYILAGFVETGACFATAIYVLQSWGYPASGGYLSSWNLPVVAPNGPLPSEFCTGPSGSCTDDDISNYQNLALRTSNAAYFMCIVFMQMFNILACKTRKVSLLRHGMRNMVTNFGFIWAAGIVFIIVYVPGLNSAVGAAPLNNILYYLIPIPFGLLLLALLGEGRKTWIRRHPKGLVARAVGW